MLEESRRRELDAIVQDMIRNKESDANIRFVVEDFKKKYTAPETVQNEQGKTFLQKAGGTLVDVAKGAIKGAGETIFNTGKLANAGLEKLGILPEVGDRETPDYLEAKTTGEKIGKFGEKVAEFAIPGTKISKATKSVGLLKKVAVEAAAGGGITAIQKGEVGKDAVDNTIISSLFPVAGKAFSSIKNILRSSENGGRVINSLIKPLLKDFSYGKNPGRAVAEEGIVASNLDELASKISQRRRDVGSKLEEVLSSQKASSIKLDLSDALSPIDEALVQANKSPRTNSALIQRLKDVRDDILGVTVNENGEEIITRNLSDLTPLEATLLKRDIGDITKFTGNASDDALVNKALKRSYGNIKGKVDMAVPEAQPLSERYADLTSAEVATKYRDKITERANLIQFGETTVGLGSALVTAVSTGGSAVPSIIVGLGAAGLRKALSTPVFKTNFAKWLAKATPAEKESLFKAAPWSKGIVLEINKGD